MRKHVNYVTRQRICIRIAVASPKICERTKASMRYLENKTVLRNLYLDDRLWPMTRVAYGLLRIHPKNTIAQTARMLGIKYDTFRGRVRQLQEYDWAYEFRHPETRKSIIVPSMPLTVEQLVADELLRARNYSGSWGEWLLHRWLDYIVDDDDCTENSRPESLVTGFGSYRLELDREFHQARVGIEFQGKYHLEAGPSKEDQARLKQQQQRDALKSLICARQDITFVEIFGNELSYETLVRKLGHLLPIIPPRKDRPIFRALTDMSHSYANQFNR